MEKFGIFELLDTLSAITTAAEEEKRGGSENPPEANGRETVSPPDAGERYEQTAPARRNADALSAFLSRHDAISKNIDKNK